MNWRFSELGWRLLPGGIAALAIAALLKLGVLQPAEQLAYTALFQARGEVPWDDRLVLVAIDDGTLKRLGRFPFSRKYYAQLVDRLDTAGASVVALDVLFSEQTPEDQGLAQAMVRSGRVVLAQADEQIEFPLLPVPQLYDAALAAGHTRAVMDADGIVRKLDPQFQNNIAFGLAAIDAYALAHAAIPSVDRRQPMWLNWSGSVTHLRRYSFADVVQGRVNDRVFRNKIVIVGATAAGLDPLRTPFNLNVPASGVHLQATLIHNVLQNNILQPVRSTWVLLVLGGPLLSLILSFWRTEIQALIAFGSTLGWGGVSLLLLKFNYLIPVAFPIGLIVSTTILVVLTERLRMNAMLQQQVRQLWQRYESDLVISPPDLREPPPLPPTSLASMQRVTQLAALAERFGRSQSTQAAIARNLSMGLAAADFDGLVWFCNPTAATLLKLEIGSRLEIELVPHWLSDAEWQDALTTLQSEKSARPKERLLGTRWYCLGLEPLTYQTHAALDPPSAHDALPPDGGSHFRLDGILLLLEDISDRKKIEASLDQQIDELHQMSQLKDDFLSTVSHELRTPLTNMKMAIQLLKMVGTEAQRDHYLQILDNECTRETELINDLLDLQRLEVGGQVLRPEHIDLRTWLPELIEPFYKRTEARRQALTVRVDEDLPDIECDRSSLERVIVELVNNACKYTPPEGEILVTADMVDPDFKVMVCNSGVEIPEEELSRVFDRFYRVPKADPWKQGGTGLGLALVKRLVECLNGKIQVSSGGGWTTFIVNLPADEV
ncbi:CHASE2 domain-containing protein [Myxacorys almedinensis]|uniref:histidine kinase n=1 Tax=Myxacorys almedinensis A TaxID=2690445 RepID=A0A8J7ZA25_9CYAN|nr:CHASE2 domain-containing protein [Myxacorys almedinensis]NDJ19153.1 CHASE2 domain-containing protein [Myxacorys almedinensis A]